MGALPKRKYARARQGRRRSHLALAPLHMVECPQCHSLRLPHRVCQVCGTYGGREAIVIKTRAAHTHTD